MPSFSAQMRQVTIWQEALFRLEAEFGDALAALD
jgi:hypothetical protein